MANVAAPGIPKQTDAESKMLPAKTVKDEGELGRCAVSVAPSVLTHGGAAWVLGNLPPPLCAGHVSHLQNTTYPPHHALSSPWGADLAGGSPLPPTHQGMDISERTCLTQAPDEK